MKRISIEKKSNKEEINYLKKFQRKINFFKFVILIIIIIVFIILGRRIIIISKLSKLANNLDSNTNYYAKMYLYDRSKINIVESYYKNGIFLTKNKTLSEDSNGQNNVTIYQNPNSNETITLVEYSNEKLATIQNTVENTGAYTISKTSSVIEFNNLSFKDMIEYLINIKDILETTCNEKDCYLIELWEGPKVWMDKATGLPVREMERDGDSSISDITDYQYEFDIVTDSDVSRPDISGYVIE